MYFFIELGESAINLRRRDETQVLGFKPTKK